MVRDFALTETADFWREGRLHDAGELRAAEIGTEVFFPHLGEVRVTGRDGEPRCDGDVARDPDTGAMTPPFRSLTRRRRTDACMGGCVSGPARTHRHDASGGKRVSS